MKVSIPQAVGTVATIKWEIGLYIVIVQNVSIPQAVGTVAT